jgi:ubiquinone/menaquinone biosynthesis C-methylase UbiE
VDIAAGTLWAAPTLLAEPIERLVCVEYSRHRLLEIGPRMLEHYGADPARITLALGSFYELAMPDDSVDFAFLSQAFHHADRPAALLAELRRVLADDGVVMIAGEHRVRIRQYAIYAAHACSSLLPASLRRRLPFEARHVRMTLRPTGEDLEPADPVLGDHLYTTREYDGLFREAGFRSHALPAIGRHYRSFLLTPAGRRP